MAKLQLIFNKPWPMAGEIRKPGEILFEGISPIPNVTPEKIIHAIKQGVVEIRPVNKSTKKNEKKDDHTGDGSLS